MHAMFDFILKKEEEEKYSEIHSLCLMFSGGHAEVTSAMRI